MNTPLMIRPFKWREVVLSEGMKKQHPRSHIVVRESAGYENSSNRLIRCAGAFGPQDDKKHDILLIYLWEPCLNVMRRETIVAYASQTRNRKAW
jgi:hypothetical protein